MRWVGALGAAVVAAMAVAVAPAHAADVRIVSEQRIAPRVVELTISTPAFAEPTKVHVDLPTGYDAQPSRRWPVSYFLAGTMNTYKSFNSVVDGVQLTANYPSIVVSPNGDSGYWSDWFNGGALGPPMYESYVIGQLIPLIDAHFRTIADRSQRVVAGVSMGGYGATMLAARHPDLFAGVASISGADDSNLPTLGAALTASSAFQGAPPDAIYGPRSSEEVRWRGHNPTDLADNLRSMDVQVRSANGVPAPGIGENAASADSVSCVVEGGVYMGSVSLHETLDRIGVRHLWKDYGPGCHTKPNFKREIADTLQSFTALLARKPKAPATFDYASIEPAFGVWGWAVATDPRRPLEFMRLRNAGSGGLTLAGSGSTSVTSPPMFRDLTRVGLIGATRSAARPDGAGRIHFAVDLGAPSQGQQYRPGTVTRQVTRRVTLRPYARATVTRARASHTRARACVRAAGGTVRARMRVTGAHRRGLTRMTRLRLGPKTACRWLRLARRPRGAEGVVRIVGSDALGHHVTARRAVRLRVVKRR